MKRIEVSICLGCLATVSISRCLHGFSVNTVSLCMLRRHMAGVEVWLHALLTLALDEIEWSDSRSGRFSLEDRARGAL